MSYGITMMSNVKNDFDAIIAGGGMIGAAVAIGLAQEGLRVAMIERQSPAPFDASSHPDIRISAISCASVSLLKQLGAWQHVLAMRSAPYLTLETWEEENAHVVFDAKSLGLPELGYMVENRILQLALWQEAERYSNITLLCPNSLSKMTYLDDKWKVTLSDGSEVTINLVVGADGANSQVRQFAGIGSNGWQYRQSCMLITVKTELPPEKGTWQRFYPSGPRAYLPLFDNWACLVWYDSPERIRKLQNMSMTQLEKEIQHAFPERLGKATPIAAGSFPLTRQHASRYVDKGIILLGDAAHTINPLAGQGVNLGYRDVDCFLDLVADAKKHFEPWDSMALLKKYQRRRMPDNLVMQAGMDVFYHAFSHQLPGLKVVRNIGLLAAQHAGKAKEAALRYALGIK